LDPERRRGGELGLPDHGFIGAGLHRAGVEEQADGYATARRRFLPVLSQLALITQSARVAECASAQRPCSPLGCVCGIAVVAPLPRGITYQPFFVTVAWFPKLFLEKGVWCLLWWSGEAAFPVVE